jgi:hypothetical protein
MRRKADSTGLLHLLSAAEPANHRANSLDAATSPHAAEPQAEEAAGASHGRRTCIFSGFWVAQPAREPLLFPARQRRELAIATK